jgi:hypothetical protein
MGSVSRDAGKAAGTLTHLAFHVSSRTPAPWHARRGVSIHVAVRQESRRKKRHGGIDLLSERKAPTNGVYRLALPSGSRNCASMTGIQICPT